MATTLTPQEIADKQIRNAAANVSTMVAGIQRTTKDPMQLAKKAKPKMQANFQKAMSDGSYERGCDGVTKSDWQEITVKKTQERYASGLEDSRNKQVQFQEQRSAHIKATQGEIDAMPNLTDADGDSRMIANLKRMRKFRFVKRGAR